jgi:alkaline phosphatase
VLLACKVLNSNLSVRRGTEKNHEKSSALTRMQNRLVFASRRYIQRGYYNKTEDIEWQVERHTLEDFVTTVVSHGSSSIRGLLERIHSIVAPQQRKGSRLQGPGIFEQLKHAIHVSR